MAQALEGGRVGRSGGGHTALHTLDSRHLRFPGMQCAILHWPPLPVWQQPVSPEGQRVQHGYMQTNGRVLAPGALVHACRARTMPPPSSESSPKRSARSHSDCVVDSTGMGSL